MSRSARSQPGQQDVHLGGPLLVVPCGYLAQPGFGWGIRNMTAPARRPHRQAAVTVLNLGTALMKRAAERRGHARRR